MHGNEEEQLPRPRPLSGGIWALFSWLRRSDRSSSESISSVGSDRTAASFDFLEPTEYGISSPSIILPLNPPTDTYNKRLYDRDIRREYDRDLTIHRKYGLLRFEEYESFTLPATCHIKSNINRNYEYQRQRRAISESYRRRVAYVPGKRRAPPPPSTFVAATLPRYKRKRPAPKPPNGQIEKDKENFELEKRMQTNKNKIEGYDLQSFRIDAVTHNRTKHEYERAPKDKSLLKQIFENRKSNSNVDTSHVKFLPSISELDKQALEIIEANKAFKAGMEGRINSKSKSENSWICTKCLRKYQASVKVCVHCQSLELKVNNESTKRFSVYTETDGIVMAQTSKTQSNEKEKLKEMLKEMKDSLPKRSKQNVIENKIMTESSTLRIGDRNTEEQASTSNKILKNDVNINVQVSKIIRDTKKKEMFLNPNLTTSMTMQPNITTQHPSSPNKGNESIQVLQNNAKYVTNIEKESKPSTSSNLTKSNVCVTFKSVETSFSKPSTSVLSNTHLTPLNKDATQTNNLLKSQRQLENTSATENNKIPNQNLVTKTFITKDETEGCDIANKIHTPLKISTLLNPVTEDSKDVKKYVFQKEENVVKYKTKVETDSQEAKINEVKLTPVTNQEVKPSIKSDKVINVNLSSTSDSPPNISSNLSTDIQKRSAQKVETTPFKQNYHKENVTMTNSFPNSNLASSNGDAIFVGKDLEILNEHSRRRNLVNQLEQSISRGDSKAAATAASELAKLRLSCSVLSFSSQIVADNSIKKINNDNDESTNSYNLGAIQKPVVEKPLQQEMITSENTSVKSFSQATQISLQHVTRADKNSPLKSKNHIEYDTTLQAGPSSSIMAKHTTELVPIQVWVEDKKAARGPVRICIRRNALMIDLMRHAETSLGLPINLQRWIVGKNLCTDDKTPLSVLAGDDLTAPFYLCLVESGLKNNISLADSVKTATTNAKPAANPKESNNTKSGDVYKELINLEKEAIVPNSEPFECEVCLEQCVQGEGAILRECIHIFCRNCLADAVRHCQEPVVSCPALDCSGALQEREIRALLTVEEYERWLARSLVTAECGTRNTFHCRTADCTGWAFCEPGVRTFPCPVCKHNNCIPCQALHEDRTCEEYQNNLKKAVSEVEKNQVDEGTRSFLNSLIRRGEALECPECNAIITKKWGCDWVKCSACKTEICWVTKGRRWGPGGKGDTSAGCRCGVDGKRCHPTCGYCH